MNTKRIHIESFGCTTNLADGEVLAGCLDQAGFILTDSESEADVIVYNSCSVKGPTENRLMDRIRRVPVGKKVIVAGCLPMTSYDRLQESARFDGVVGPAAGMDIVTVVNRVLSGEKVEVLDRAPRSKPEYCLPRIRSSSLVSLVPVNYGCLGSCAYCCVVFARGRLRSYTIEEIVRRVESDVSSGAQEVWLTSQDMACYGRDLGKPLPDLLEAVCGVNGDFRVRVGMMTPNLVLDLLPQLIDAFGNPKIFKFLHLPAQSGDDLVLKAMNRRYSTADFKRIVREFRAAYPEVALATDVICGFPGESKEAFCNTLRLIDEVQPDIVNVSKFFARPRTVAASITEGIVDPLEIKRRSGEMARLSKKLSFERNQSWIGWTGSIFIDEKGKSPGSWVGRNFAYKPITVKSNLNLIGKKLTVKVQKAFTTYLAGGIVESQL
jgi:threonylcarbamoyladenosine tRNA methylthiotransferase CDKAL1